MGDRRKTALVTGASSGIGQALAELLAKDNYDLVLVARREDRLQALQKEWSERYSIAVRVVAMDLAAHTSPPKLFDALEGNNIDVLINNAGFASYGPFATSNTANEMDMIQVNVTTLTHLTRLFLPQMIERGEGRIMNIASTAAFVPGPLMAVYYATKAYVLSFSEALAEELRGSGVTVTAYCPGPVATEFQERAKLARSGLLRYGLVEIGPIAAEGYRAMMSGKVVAIPGLPSKLVSLAARLTPRSILRRAVKKVQSQVVKP